MKNLKRVFTLVLTLVLLVGVLPMETMATIPGSSYPTLAGSVGEGDGWPSVGWIAAASPVGVTLAPPDSLDAAVSQAESILLSCANWNNNSTNISWLESSAGWLWPNQGLWVDQYFLHGNGVAEQISYGNGPRHLPAGHDRNMRTVDGKYNANSAVQKLESLFTSYFSAIYNSNGLQGAIPRVGYEVPAVSEAEALDIMQLALPMKGRFGAGAYGDSATKAATAFGSFINNNQAPANLSATPAVRERWSFMRSMFLSYCMAAFQGAATQQDIVNQIYACYNGDPYTPYAVFVEYFGPVRRNSTWYWTTAGQTLELANSGWQGLIANDFSNPQQCLNFLSSSSVNDIGERGALRYTWGTGLRSAERTGGDNCYCTSWSMYTATGESMVDAMRRAAGVYKDSITISTSPTVSYTNYASAYDIPPKTWSNSNATCSVTINGKTVTMAQGLGYFFSPEVFDLPTITNSGVGTSDLGDLSEKIKPTIQVDARVGGEVQQLKQGANTVTMELSPRLLFEPEHIATAGTIYNNPADAPDVTFLSLKKTIEAMQRAVARAGEVGEANNHYKKAIDIKEKYDLPIAIAPPPSTAIDKFALNPKVKIYGWCWYKFGAKVSASDGAYLQKFIHGYYGDGSSGLDGNSAVMGDADEVGTTMYNPYDGSAASVVDAAVRAVDDAPKQDAASIIAAVWGPTMSEMGFTMTACDGQYFEFTLEGATNLEQCYKYLTNKANTSTVEGTSVTVEGIDNVDDPTAAEITHWLYISCNMDVVDYPLTQNYTVSVHGESNREVMTSEGPSIEKIDEDNYSGSTLLVTHKVTCRGMSVNWNKADFLGSTVEEPEKPKYHSAVDTSPHVEMNQGTINKGATGPTGKFNSMTGTPTFTETERQELIDNCTDTSYYQKDGHYYQYFAAGGSEFVVEFDGEFHHNETATRTYVWNFTGGDNCSLSTDSYKCPAGHTHCNGYDSETGAHLGDTICDDSCVHAIHCKNHPHVIGSVSTQFVITYTGLDYVEITNLKVWQLSEAQVTGTYRLLDQNYVMAEIKSNGPSISYNIAGANTSAAGRMVYEYEPTKLDTVTYSYDLPNTCGGEADFMSGKIEADCAKITLGAYMVSDYIVLHTTAGDEFVYYYEKHNKNGNCPLQYSVSTSSGAPAFGSSSGSASITVSNATQEFEPTTSDDLWKANPHASYEWDPAGITYGGYNGDYLNRSSKYKTQQRGNPNDKSYWATTQAAMNKSGVFGKREQNKGHISQSTSFRPDSSLRLMNDTIKIPDTKKNGQYDFTGSSVWYKNLVYYEKTAGGFETAYGNVSASPYHGTGFALTAGYGSNDYLTKCNGIVVYNPVSNQNAGIVPLDSSRDQRIGVSTVSTPISYGCPEDATCPYMQLNCQYTGNHLHNDSCYTVITNKVHSGYNTHEHTDECKRSTIVSAISGYAASPSAPYCWRQSNSSCGYHNQYAYSSSATSFYLCDSGWVRVPEFDYSGTGALYLHASTCSNHYTAPHWSTIPTPGKAYCPECACNAGMYIADTKPGYACGNLPLNKHSCVVTTGATIGGASEKTFTGNGTVTLQPGSYNIALGGGKGGGSNGGNGGTVTGVLNLNTTTTISYGNDGGGAGYDGNGGSAAWVAVGSYSRLSAVPTDKLIAVAGGGGAGNGGVGQGGGPNMAGTNGASQCGGYGEGGQLNRGGAGGHDARSGGYGYGGDGNCTYGCSGNEENGGGGGYYGGGGGGHDCTSYNDFDDGDGGGGSGYASSTYLSGIGGSTGANSSSSYVKFTGGTTTTSAGCYDSSIVIFNCKEPHHAWDSNWHAYTIGRLHKDGKTCTGLSCTNTTPIMFRGNNYIALSELANGQIVRHTDGNVHLTRKGVTKCDTCGKSFTTVLFDATPTSRTNVTTDEWEHFEVGNSYCWEACHNRNGEHDYVNTVPNPINGTPTLQGTWVQLDWVFTLYFPNTGDFYGTGRKASGNCTAERGMGYTDGMDTTEWIKYKWVEFPFDVVYRKTTYPAGTRIYLQVPDVYFEFYVPLENTESANVIIQYGTTAINDSSPQVLDDSRRNEFVNTRPMANNGHPHEAQKDTYVDVVGRIGALTMNDVGDFRFSNFFKKTVEGWLVPNVLRRVDTSRQLNILTDSVDVRGVGLNDAYFKSTTLDNYLEHDNPSSVTTNTYGSFVNDRAEASPYRFPLVPSLLQTVTASPFSSNQKSLASQPMRIGYNAYLDFTTLGNYYGTEHNQDNPASGNWVSVKPHYYRMDISTGELTPADVYMMRDGKYVLINDADQTIRYNSSDPSDFNIQLNWVEECGRRNYYGSEKRNTEAVYEQTGVGMPQGSSWVYGNYDTQILTGRNRTCIGTNTTYGISTDPSHLLGNLRFWLQGARWHTSLGLPSSAVFVRSGDTPTTETVKNFYTKSGKTDQYVIVVSLEIYAYGDVWSLAYEGNNINSQGVQVTPTTPKVTPHLPGEPTPPKYPDNPGKEMPLVSIISINHSSKEDINQAGTH